MSNAYRKSLPLASSALALLLAACGGETTTYQFSPSDDTPTVAVSPAEPAVVSPAPPADPVTPPATVPDTHTDNGKHIGQHRHD